MAGLLCVFSGQNCDIVILMILSNWVENEKHFFVTEMLRNITIHSFNGIDTDIRLNFVLTLKYISTFATYKFCDAVLPSEPDAVSKSVLGNMLYM